MSAPNAHARSTSAPPPTAEVGASSWLIVHLQSNFGIFNFGESVEVSLHMAPGPTPKSFVLVHGAFHGGWCWSRVADILRSRGHLVTTPTLTGLGERSHLLSDAITPSVFIDDIVNHLKWEDLTEVILVGHSLGGITITGVADAVPDRLKKLVYFDAVIIEHGEAMFDIYPQERVDALLAIARETSGGISAPPSPPEFYGIFDPDDAAFVKDRLTPQPIATFTTPLMLNNPVGNGLPTHYIKCIDPVLTAVTVFHDRAVDAGWPIVEIAACHDAMVTAPLATADLLEGLSTF